MNTQDWSPLEWTGWISLQSNGLSRVFSNTTNCAVRQSWTWTRPPGIGKPLHLYVTPFICQKWIRDGVRVTEIINSFNFIFCVDGIIFCTVICKDVFFLFVFFLSYCFLSYCFLSILVLGLRNAGFRDRSPVLNLRSAPCWLDKRPNVLLSPFLSVHFYKMGCWHCSQCSWDD